MKEWAHQDKITFITRAIQFNQEPPASANLGKNAMLRIPMLIAAMVTLSASAFAGDCSPGSPIYEDAFFKLCDRERDDARAKAAPKPNTAEDAVAPSDVGKSKTPAATESLRDVRDGRAGARR